MAEDDEAVYNIIDKHNYGTWSERDTDSDFDEGNYDLEGNSIAGGYKAWVMACRGDLSGEESDYYYGVTQYGWELVENATPGDMAAMLELGIASLTLG